MSDLQSDKPLSDLSYKELQYLSRKSDLPANVKRSQMLTLLEARQNGDGETVTRVLGDIFEGRLRRRSKYAPSLESLPELEEVKSKGQILAAKKQNILSMQSSLQTDKSKDDTKSSATVVTRKMRKSDDDSGLHAMQLQSTPPKNVRKRNYRKSTAGAVTRKLRKSDDTSGLHTLQAQSALPKNKRKEDNRKSSASGTPKKLRRPDVISSSDIVQLEKEGTATQNTTALSEVTHHTEPFLHTPQEEIPMPLPRIGLPGPSTSHSTFRNIFHDADVSSHHNLYMKQLPWSECPGIQRSDSLSSHYPDILSSAPLLPPLPLPPPLPTPPLPTPPLPTPPLQTPHSSLLSPLVPIYIPEADTARHLESSQFSSFTPLLQTCDHSTGRHDVLPPPVPQSPYPPLLTPPYYSEHITPHFPEIIFSNSANPPEHNLPGFVQPDHYVIDQEKNDMTNERNLVSSLELILNMKSVVSTTTPKLWRSASTYTCQCYNTPLCSTVMFPETELPRMDTEHTNIPEDSFWCSGNGHQAQQASFPEFRQNNQISYPLIYNYVASAEEELKQQNEPLHQTYTEWTNDVQNRPQAISSPIQPLPLVNGEHFLPIEPNIPKVDDLMNFIHDDKLEPRVHYAGSQLLQQNDETHLRRGSCQNKKMGCRKVYLEHSLLQQHEEICEFQRVECYNGCIWHGCLKFLALHLREMHRSEIVCNTEASHTVSLHEVRASQTRSFLHEVNKRLFIVTIQCHGHLLYATVQFVPVWKRGKLSLSLVKASLEVVGADGSPHSWRGKVRPVYEPLPTLLATDQCLLVDPAAIGSFAGANITLHTKITIYVTDHK